MFDPYVWTHFSSGKLMIVRQSHLEGVRDAQEKTRENGPLLSPWADALAASTVHMDLLKLQPVGEA